MPYCKTYGRKYTANIDVAQRENEWLTTLEIDIKTKSRFENNILINLTWFNPEEDNLYAILEENDPLTTKIWLAASIDGINWMYNGKFHNILKLKSFTYSFVGFGPTIWNSWMPKWIYENNRKHNVTLENDFKYYFLSYNRKPKPHRYELVDKIVKNNLLKSGWITYTENVFNEIDQYTGNTDQELINEDKRFSRPEDMSTLGNLDIWNNSFCIIVTETEFNDPWQISEKTWKPIMGLRPYITIGHNNINNILNSLGFYSGNDLFDYKFNSIDNTIDFLKLLTSQSKANVYEMYIKMLPKLQHNKNKLIELAYKTNIL